MFRALGGRTDEEIETEEELKRQARIKELQKQRLDFEEYQRHSYQALQWTDTGETLETDWCGLSAQSNSQRLLT